MGVILALLPVGQSPSNQELRRQVAAITEF